MNNETNVWSKNLQQQTREAIRDMPINPDGKLHFKNRDKRSAYMTVQDVLCGKLSLADKESGQVSEYADADELLAAGWAID